MKKYKVVFGTKLLPERREIKPIGRIILFGRELDAQETRDYCTALRGFNVYTERTI